MRVETTPGRYVVQGVTLCTLWSPPDDADRCGDQIARAVLIGESRTLTHDPAYGVRQLVDVALRAMSPGTHDPTTAQDAIFHLAAVLHEMLLRDPPPTTRTGPEGRRVLLPATPSHDHVIRLAFDELRQVAAPSSAVCSYLLEAIRLAGEGLQGPGGREVLLQAALRHQAVLIVAACRLADLAPWDLEGVERDFEERFAPRPDAADAGADTALAAGGAPAHGGRVAGGGVGAAHHG